MELLFRFLANSSIDDIAKIFKRMNISIMNNDGSYKTIDTIFNELANKVKVEKEEKCVCCGESIPEGRQVCAKCESKYDV